MPFEGLVIKTMVEGADQSARDLDQVEDAKARVNDTVSTGVKATDEARESQEKLNASESDFVGLLDLIVPGMGRYADALFKADRVGQEFNVGLDNTAQSASIATSAIGSTASTLKVLAGGLALGIGFSVISRAIGSVVNRSKELRAELDALRNEQSSRADEATQVERDIASRSRTRPEGVFGGAEQVRAGEEFQAIAGSGRVAEDLLEALKSNTAALSGLLDAAAIERLTIAGFEADISLPAEARRRIAQHALHDPSVQAIADREAQRLSEQEARERRAALEELASRDTSSDANIDRLIEEIAGSAFDSDEIKELIRTALNIREQVQTEAGRSRFAHAGRGDVADAFVNDDLARLVQLANRSFFGFLPQAEVAQVVAKVIEELDRGAGPTVVNNMQFGRFIGPSTQSRRERSVIGEVESRERVEQN